MSIDRNPFFDERGNRLSLCGVVLYSGSPRVAEFAARTGYDTVWIDLEHGTHDWRDAEAMCVAVEAGGGTPLVRTMGSDRDQVMRALEIGGKIIVVPMVNDAATARDVARWGKYRPVGERGFYKYSRGLRYGEDPNWMENVNRSAVLMPQIETLEAVENLAAILGVEGVDGVFVGPGDLSADMGKPGEFGDAEVKRTVADCLRAARAAGKLAGFLSASQELTEMALGAGADLVVFDNDIPALRKAWAPGLEHFRRASGRAQST